MADTESIGLASPNECFGCSACIAACGKGALRINGDERGFYRPVLDESLCVKCGACAKACPAVGEPTPRSEPIRTLAAWDSNHSARLSATSGGVFMLLAQEFVAQGGWVCGAIMNADLEVGHVVTNDIDVIQKMRGSKYVQSRVDEALRDCLKLLSNGEKVLFSGTGCQVDAMRRLARGKLSERLVLVDVLCHGAPSPRVWYDYVSFRARETGSKPVAARFRKKEPSWTVFSLEMDFQNGQRKSWCTVEDYYLRAFLGDYISQVACHSCPYTRTDRVSDVTLADFWGYVSDTWADRNTEEGISLVLVNSGKGNALLESSGSVHLIDKPLAEAVKGNPPLRAAFPANRSEEDFWGAYETGGFNAVVEDYLGPRRFSFKHRISLWFNDHAYLIPRGLRQALIEARGRM